MASDDFEFRKQSFQALSDEPFAPDDPRYVDLFEAEEHDDPVALMVQTIELSRAGSTQLFAGLRGTGKTTSLLRLGSVLSPKGYKVVYLNMDRYLNTSTPIDVTGFLITLAGAFGECMAVSEYLGAGSTNGYWFRLAALHKKLFGVDMQGASASGIKNDPTLLPLLQKRFDGRIKALATDVRDYFAHCTRSLQARYGGGARIVVLVDSLEHLRGAFTNAQAVQDSLVSIFIDHAGELKIPDVHIIYGVPLYLKVRSMDLSARYGLGAVHVLPAVKVRDRQGELSPRGVQTLREVLKRRVDTTRLLGDEASLEKIVLASGGVLRDLLRITGEIIRRTRTLPAPADVVSSAIDQMRNEFLPIVAMDMASLVHVARSHELVIEAPDELHAMSRLVDAHLLLLYRNGREWYDVHPLIKDIVLQRVHDPSSSPTIKHPEPTAPSSAKLPRAPSSPAILTREMSVTLVVESYRALRRVRWTLPRGVTALVGPNGSGKTTLLDVPELLRHALEHDTRKAVDDRGGPGTLRNMQAERGAPVLLGIALDEVSWHLDLSPKGAAFNPLYGEQATAAGAVLLDRGAPSSEPRAEDARPLLRRFAELPEGAAFRPLVTLLQGYRFYQTYDLASIRLNGSQLSSDEHLHPDGRNVFSLLRNWRDRKETRPRWEFVIASLKAAFPDTFDDLDFDMAGQTVSGRIVAPQPDVRIPTYLAANGWLVALLHLCAVASTPPAGAVAIDEVENGLHPYAIRQLIEAMRRWASDTGISVVLSTHSPVVLDQFKDEPGHLFVMEPGREMEPVRLDELHDPEWLAHFSLGDLYSHDEFGAQHKDDQRVA